MCDIYNDFTTHGLFSEKCFICLLGVNLENTIESQEHTFTAQHTKVLTPKTPHKPAKDQPATVLLGFPQPPHTAVRFLLSSGAAAAPHASDTADSGCGHVMQGWVCVSDDLVFKYIILSRIVMSYKLHPT